MGTVRDLFHRYPPFVKTMGLGFAIPYVHNGQAHNYVPEFLVLLKTDRAHPLHLILETKGLDPLEPVKRATAKCWVKAVNTDGQLEEWRYAVARKPSEVTECLQRAVSGR